MRYIGTRLCIACILSAHSTDWIYRSISNTTRHYRGAITLHDRDQTRRSIHDQSNADSDGSAP